jgi:hypothetical protein
MRRSNLIPFFSVVVPLMIFSIGNAQDRENAAKNRNKQTAALLESAIGPQSRLSSDDGRGYRSHINDNRIETAGKLAFGYFVTGRFMIFDDSRRYSYQLQSYLADGGSCPMLYIDEMELLMSRRGGDMRCGGKECAMRLGELLGVDYMGYGKIRKFFNFYSIEAGIIDVPRGTTLIREKRRFRGKDFVFVNEIIPQLAYELGEAFKRMSTNGRLASRR